MAKAVAPSEIPALPAGCTGWARSTKRIGGMFHAHVLGITACGSIHLDRYTSKEVSNLGEMQYWGVCPRCLAKAEKRVGV